MSTHRSKSGSCAAGPLAVDRRRCLQAVAGLGAGWVWPVPAAEALQAPALLLARRWQAAEDPGEYLVSEKFDGVRACWDGRRLISRGGLVLAAPAGFLARLPPVPLDGELWLARGRFEAVSALVRRQTASESDWQAVRYLVFEQPGGDGSFAQRHARLRQLLPAQDLDQPGPQVVDQQRVAGSAALQAWLERVVAQGGEGLVLHRADAPYLTGRQSVLAKLKPVADAEALVIGHEPGQGRLAGRLGALRVRNEAGQEFRIGSGLSDAQRAQPPAIGTVITYAWRGETGSGLPRFATFVRVSDPAW